MKILYHHRTRSKDGQYVHIEELTNALRDIGHEIVIVGPPGMESEEFGADAGIVAILKKFLPKFVYELLELAYSFLDYQRIAKVARTFGPDCLYERYNLYLLSGVWLKKRLKIPMLLEVNAPLYAERKKFDGIALDWLARWAEHKAWTTADYVLPVTKVLANRMIKSGVSETKIRVVPNAINQELFNGITSTESAKKSLGLEGNLVLGFVGFMREWHGLDRVVRIIAASKGQNRHLLLVGDGPARQTIEKQAKELGVEKNITIVGIVPRESVANYISAFDIALQPEVVEYASPLKLFEYLALGRAIVAPATDNIKEILKDECNAVLFDPMSDEDFSYTIEKVCSDQKLREKTSTAARRTIIDQGLTWENNARRVTSFYQELGVGGEKLP